MFPGITRPSLMPLNQATSTRCGDTIPMATKGWISLVMWPPPEMTSPCYLGAGTSASSSTSTRTQHPGTSVLWSSCGITVVLWMPSRQFTLGGIQYRTYLNGPRRTGALSMRSCGSSVRIQGQRNATLSGCGAKTMAS